MHRAPGAFLLTRFIFNHDFFMGERMDKRHAKSMEVVGPVLRQRPVVKLVSNNRMADMGQVGADLMRPASFQSQVKQRFAFHLL